jgi:putative tryptophan/tyrosine transport system substrate-binding protein
MRRREFIAGLGSAAWPLAAQAQQQTKPTIAWLELFPGGTPPDAAEGFRRGLAQFGFSEGHDVMIEYRTADGYQERLPALAADLVRQRPVAVVAPNGFSALAAKSATPDIPIIFLAGYDPVELGLVASLNRPGGNLTGVVLLSTEIAEKRLQLLHEAVPAAETIALLVGPADIPFNQIETMHMLSAARTLGLRLLVFNVTIDTEITPVFATLVEHRAGAVLIGGSVIVGTKSDQIRAHGLRFALLTMFAYSTEARAGGLLSYGPDIIEAFRQMGIYTGRVLKGEKPADLPVMRATKMALVINLKTANALGLNLPPTLLAIADEVIE